MQFALQDVKLQSLWLQPCHTCRSRAHDTKNHARCLLRLMSLVPTLFNSLRTLSFIDCMVPTEFVAGLLGPLGTLRTSIESLTLVHGGTLEETTLQFLLEWLLFNHTSEVLCQGGAPATMDYVEPTQSQRIIAATDWQKFAELSVYAEWTEETERLYLESPPSAHPFSALTTFHISIASETGDEIFLVFLTGTFPALRHLTIEGKFVAWVLVPSERFFLRRSIHR